MGWRLLITGACGLLTASCVSLQPDDFVELEKSLSREDLPQDVGFAADSCDWDGFRFASTGSGDSAAALQGGDPVRLGPAGEEIYGKTIFKETVAIFHDISRSRAERRGDLRAPKERSFSSGELEDFGDVFGSVVLDPRSYIDSGAQKFYDKKNDLTRAFALYYRQYISKGFVTRFGTTLAKPEIKTTIGNETISAALQVFLEAAADTILKTPVLVVKDAGGKVTKYYPSKSTTPPSSTVDLFGHDAVIATQDIIADDTNGCGIIESEAKAIAYVANLAGDKSSLVSKLVLEAIGDVELALVVGGHFSIGDNETLATIVATFMEGVSLFGSERIAYEFFWDFKASKGVSLYKDQGLKDVAAFVNFFEE